MLHTAPPGALLPARVPGTPGPCSLPWVVLGPTARRPSSVGGHGPSVVETPPGTGLRGRVARSRSSERAPRPQPGDRCATAPRAAVVGCSTGAWHWTRGVSTRRAGLLQGVSGRWGAGACPGFSERTRWARPPGRPLVSTAQRESPPSSTCRRGPRFLLKPSLLVASRCHGCAGIPGAVPFPTTTKESGKKIATVVNTELRA